MTVPIRCSARMARKSICANSRACSTRKSRGSSECRNGGRHQASGHGGPHGGRPPVGSGHPHRGTRRPAQGRAPGRAALAQQGREIEARFAERLESAARRLEVLSPNLSVRPPADMEIPNEVDYIAGGGLPGTCGELFPGALRFSWELSLGLAVASPTRRPPTLVGSRDRHSPTAHGGSPLLIAS